MRLSEAPKRWMKLTAPKRACALAEFAFHVGRHALRVPVVLTCERNIGLQVLLDDSVEGGLLGMAAVWGRSASR